MGIYDIIQMCSMVAWVIFYVFYGKHYGISKMKSLLISLISCIGIYLSIFLLTWVENGFRNFGAQNAVRVFCFIPLFILLESKIFNIEFRRNSDYHSLFSMLWYGLGHLACVYAGCCYGFEYKEGTTMYSIAHALTGTNMLPNQLIEASSALITFVVFYFLMRKCKYDMGGCSYFYVIIVYGLQRFIFEFFRDNKKIIVFKDLTNAVTGDHLTAKLGLSSLSIWALLMVLEGIIVVIILKKKSKKSELRV